MWKTLGKHNTQHTHYKQKVCDDDAKFRKTGHSQSTYSKFSSFIDPNFPFLLTLPFLLFTCKNSAISISKVRFLNGAFFQKLQLQWSAILKRLQLFSYYVMCKGIG